MPSQRHPQPPTDDPEPPPAIDPLELVYRQMLAETMTPCREYRHGVDDEHQAALARREQLATFFGDEPAGYEQPRQRPLKAA